MSPTDSQHIHRNLLMVISGWLWGTLVWLVVLESTVHQSFWSQTYLNVSLRWLNLLVRGAVFPASPYPNWWSLFQGFVSVGLTCLLGFLFCAPYRQRLTRSESFSLALLTGLTMIGLTAQGWAMLGWLTSLTAWLNFGVLFGVGVVFLRAMPRTPCTNTSTNRETCLPISSRITAICWILTTTITILSFYHSLCFPEVYWDALSYYLYYPQLIVRESGIPFPVTSDGFAVHVQAVVGPPIAASYPHLYGLWQATASFWWGEWNDIYGRMLPPMMGLVATLLIASIATRWTGSAMIGAMAALLFRVVPQGFNYSVLATDYALVMAFGSGVLWCAFLIWQARDWKFPLWMGALLLAGAMHINYLQGMLWIPWAIALAGSRRLSQKSAWQSIAVGFALGIIWYLRNWMVTGNPVYPFFSGIFGGMNINPEVLASCQQEWIAHGDGLSLYGSRLSAQWAGVIDQVLLSARFVWKWYPLLAATGATSIVMFSGKARWIFAGLGWSYLLCAAWVFQSREAYIIALLFAGVLWCCAWWAPRTHPNTPWYTVLSAVVVLWCYGHFVSTYYSYHLILLIPLSVLLSIPLLEYLCRFNVQLMVMIWLGMVWLLVGIPFALMGPKLPTPQLIAWQIGLDPPETIIQQRYPQAWQMWQFINTHLPYGPILSHEIRHYYLKENIEFLGLDDGRIVALYNQSDWDNTAKDLAALGVEWYLETPSEASHPMTQQLGHRQHLETHFDTIYGASPYQLYRIKTHYSDQ